jgi:hypothetical protein
LVVIVDPSKERFYHCWQFVLDVIKENRDNAPQVAPFKKHNAEFNEVTVNKR